MNTKATLLIRLALSFGPFSDKFCKKKELNKTKGSKDYGSNWDKYGRTWKTTEKDGSINYLPFVQGHVRRN